LAHILLARKSSDFSVSLPVVQVGGGLVVVLMGWAMLMQDEAMSDVARRNIQGQDVFRRAFYPLTLRLMVGPESISVAVTLGANLAHYYGFHILVIIAALLAIVLVANSIALCYAFVDRLARRLGKTTVTVIGRFSAFLLVCIGVRIMWNGTSALLSSLQFQTR
jgi:multiple antibiotic resistance protein